MKWNEAKPIYDEWAMKYIANPLYHGHLHSACLMNKRDAVEYHKVEFPPGESLDDLCILVGGSPDNLPAEVPKPENTYKGLLVVYDRNEGPVELQKQ